MKVPMDRYMQYGCGHSAPDGWCNFDSSLTLRFERLPLVGSLYSKNEVRFPRNVRYGDIIKGLPIPSESCQGIYSSHVLEHLPRKGCEIALRNKFDYLKPGGIFRLVVPDLHQLAQAYLSDDSVDAAHGFMSRSGLGEEFPASGVVAMLSRVFGGSRHSWLWDERSMSAELQRAGFKAIRRCEFNDCADPQFRKVEDAARFADCLAMEAMK